MLRGFLNSDHQIAFEIARSEHWRGGAKAKCCGARTRAGGICKQPPISGSLRCLRHAGPKAARAYRETQLRELSAGQLLPAEFAKAERKRAANRLRWLWKKYGPWLAGSTIDLGPYETAFAKTLHDAGFSITRVPPGIADWLRWKFRRFMLDCKNPERWAEVLAKLAEKVKAAGDPPDGVLTMTSLPPSTFSVPEVLPYYSRRRQYDPNPVTRSSARLIAPRQLRERSISASELSNLLVRHRAEIGPILARCKSDEDRITVAAGYKRLCAAQDNPKAYRDWMTIIQSLIG